MKRSSGNRIDRNNRVVVDKNWESSVSWDGSDGNREKEAALKEKHQGLGHW